ncbi:MAG: hypothetical protein ISR65_03865 [Bacteriovoracaceae bacterium]|nr:hypothetical protein [Bacteriovoracaceae bacterium]
MNLRISYPTPKGRELTAYDPARVETASMANFVRAIYSPLIEFSNDGELVSGLASKFIWKDGAVHFYLNDNAKANDGTPITAKDAYISLKRLIILGKNTHGNLKSFICPDATVKKLDDECPGLITENNKLIITPIPSRKSLLLPLLANIEFTVIPQKSLDLNNLSIINYNITSGPYFVDKDKGNGNITLVANKYNHHYSKKIAQSITLVPVSSPQSSLIDLIENKKVDIIPTFNWGDENKLHAYFLNKNNYSIHRSMNIKTYLLKFTKRGMQELSQERRHILGAIIKKAYLETLDKNSIAQGQNQFFGVYGEGSLSDSDQKRLNETIEKAIASGTSLEKGAGIVMNVFKSQLDLNKTRYSQVLPELAFSTSPKLPFFMNYNSQEEMPHLFIVGGDTSFYENVSLLSYMISLDMFEMGQEKANEWIEDYLSIEDKNTRLKKLQKAHLAMLISASVIPLAAAPYVAIAKKPWKFEVSDQYAGTPFWQIVHDEY